MPTELNLREKISAIVQLFETNIPRTKIRECNFRGSTHQVSSLPEKFLNSTGQYSIGQYDELGSGDEDSGQEYHDPGAGISDLPVIQLLFSCPLLDRKDEDGEFYKGAIKLDLSEGLTQGVGEFHLTLESVYLKGSFDDPEIFSLASPSGWQASPEYIEGAKRTFPNLANVMESIEAIAPEILKIWSCQVEDTQA